MAVVTHMRLKHPDYRDFALSSSKSYAQEDTNSGSSNSGPNLTPTFGDPNTIPGLYRQDTATGQDRTATGSIYGDLNPVPSYSATPTYVGLKPQESDPAQFPQVHQEDEPSRIKELYPDISITVGETTMEPYEKSDWSVELLKGGRSDVKLPSMVKETPSGDQESAEVDKDHLKLKLKSYHNISFELTDRPKGSDQNGVDNLEPEVILHVNNIERREQGLADKSEEEDKLRSYSGISFEVSDTRNSKNEDKTGKIPEKNDKIDCGNDPLANCNGDDDHDVKQRLQSYPNISFEVTLTPNKRRERLKRPFEPEVILYDESDFAIDQEKQARRVLAPARLRGERVHGNLHVNTSLCL